MITNVHTIVATLVNYIPLWHCCNIDVTLETTLYHNFHTLFRQHDDNHDMATFVKLCNYQQSNSVVMVLRCVTNASCPTSTRLSQHGGNVLISYNLQHCENVVTKLPEHSVPSKVCCCHNDVWRLWNNIIIELTQTLQEHLDKDADS